MPTTLVLRFPVGQYHATPWGRHVNQDLNQHLNQGTVELPPSPWRLLRALFAVWRTRAPELDEHTVHSLLARLAEAPTFHIPRHGPSRTRHCYPGTAPRREKANIDKTLDASVVCERDAELAAVWPFDLPSSQRAALERLASSIPYFGRADSLCSGYLPTDWEPDAHDTWVPMDVADSVAEDGPATSVLTPELPLQLDTLLARPVDVRKGNLLFPVGTRLLAYQRRQTAPRPRPASRWQAQSAIAVRFSVLQAGLPPQTDALVYTDLLRQGALSKLGRLPNERMDTQLGGRTAEGKAMNGHGHAHYLPLIQDQQLSGLAVWAPNGLPDDELKALTSLDRLYTPANPQWRLTIRVAGIGTSAQVAPELTASRPAIAWCSATPFTPPRHPKRTANWASFLHAEVGRELTSRGLPPPHRVTLLHDDQWTPWRRYRPTARMRRDTRQGQTTRPSAFLRVELTKPIHGPLTLGHLSHFGLGLFTPER